MQSSVARSSHTRSPLHSDPVKGLLQFKAARLLDRVREHVRMMHYSLRTEKRPMRTGAAPSSGSSVQISATIGRPEVEAFLTHLAVDRGLAVSGYRQALSALRFLCG